MGINTLHGISGSVISGLVIELGLSLFFGAVFVFFFVFLACLFVWLIFTSFFFITIFVLFFYNLILADIATKSKPLAHAVSNSFSFRFPHPPLDQPLVIIHRGLVEGNRVSGCKIKQLIEIMLMRMDIKYLSADEF